jgi:hypothetical protein
MEAKRTAGAALLSLVFAGGCNLGDRGSSNSVITGLMNWRVRYCLTLGESLNASDDGE